MSSWLLVNNINDQDIRLIKDDNTFKLHTRKYSFLFNVQHIVFKIVYITHISNSEFFIKLFYNIIYLIALKK